MLAGGSEPAALVPIARVMKSSEHDVPDRKVRVIVVMKSFLVMNAVAFGALNPISQPMGCAHIPVIDELGQAGDQHGDRRSERFDTDEQVDDRARDDAVHEDFERVLVEARDDLDPLRAVMHLM